MSKCVGYRKILQCILLETIEYNKWKPEFSVSEALFSSNLQSKFLAKTMMGFWQDDDGIKSEERQDDDGIQKDDDGIYRRWWNRLFYP